MKVRELKEHLDKNAPKGKTSHLMTSISHWVKAIFDSDKGQFIANTLGDIDTLEKLAALDIISLMKGSGETVVAELTPSGKELYRDFTGLGYYL